MDQLATVPVNMARNRYRHASRFDGLPDVVFWGEPGGVGKPYVLSRCASFLTHVLEHAYGAGTPNGWATPQFFYDHIERSARNEGFPSASTYRAAFARGIPHFAPVTAVRELQPGDLVSIDFNRPGAIYTGHIVMIRRYWGVHEHPADRCFSRPVVPRVFEVVDCSSRPHGDPKRFPELLEAFPDTRAPLDGDTGDGAGYGHMILYEDRLTGQLAGYRRSPDASLPFTTSRHPIAAAHIEP
ncbi:hypothetical protein ACFVFQ_37990 [Streptomyces sp. NPDC057743]|uniref:hypothetical protein n=1 Tax=Streptomyces sp. NPDC057743 TaxID=3346236 RepID=UPI003680CEDC